MDVDSLAIAREEPEHVGGRGSPPAITLVVDGDVIHSCKVVPDN